MSFGIVVARYNEDVAWTKQFANVVIYNKGADKLPAEFNQVRLRNVGREGHTYYQYICDNYDALPDYVVFAQGRPFDHSPNIVAQLNACIESIENNNVPNDFEFFCERVLPCNLSGCRCHAGLPLIDVYEKLFHERKTNMSFVFGSGAQFVVSKSRILKRPRSFYQKIVELLQHDVSPIEGYVIERFHKLIFDYTDRKENETKT